jgi:hypothetical protein
MMSRFRFTNQELCDSHGFSVSTLYRLRKDGILLPGKHFLIKGQGLQRPRLLWDPEEVEKALLKRKPKKLLSHAG